LPLRRGYLVTENGHFAAVRSKKGLLWSLKGAIVVTGKGSLWSLKGAILVTKKRLLKAISWFLRREYWGP